jgi:hypothetical protein
MFPFIQRVFADSGYAGEKVTTAMLIAVEIVCKKSLPNRLRRKPASLGRRTVLRLDWTQPETGKGLRGHHRLSTRLPLRRIHHAARASDRSCYMTFETDS